MSSRALTQQERKILALVAEGKTNKEIAAEVFLSDKTVKNYVSSILAKLNLERRAQAAAYVARDQGPPLQLTSGPSDLGRGQPRAAEPGTRSPFRNLAISFAQSAMSSHGRKSPSAWTTLVTSRSKTPSWLRVTRPANTWWSTALVASSSSAMSVGSCVGFGGSPTRAAREQEHRQVGKLEPVTENERLGRPEPVAGVDPRADDDGVIAREGDHGVRRDDLGFDVGRPKDVGDDARDLGGRAMLRRCGDKNLHDGIPFGVEPRFKVRGGSAVSGW